MIFGRKAARTYPWRDLVYIVTQILHPAAHGQDLRRLPALLLILTRPKIQVTLFVVDIQARLPRRDSRVCSVEDEAPKLLFVNLVTLVKRKLVRPPRQGRRGPVECDLRGERQVFCPGMPGWEEWVLRVQGRTSHMRVWVGV